MREAPRVSASRFYSEVRERSAAFPAGTKQCSGVALMPGRQAPESIFSPLAGLLNSNLPWLLCSLENAVI